MERLKSGKSQFNPRSITTRKLQGIHNLKNVKKMHTSTIAEVPRGKFRILPR